MPITQFVRLDQNTLDPSIYSAFQSSGVVSHVAADCYKFEFEPIVLHHALQLLSLDPSRYGIDLQDYLAPVVQYYAQHCPSQLTDLAFGTTDFKRRAAENLGAAMAALLMVSVLNVRWESITQIHSAKKQRGRRPDFVGYSLTKGFVFEAKGTSRPQSINKQIKDASDQLKAMPLGGKAKIGFASFFPGEVGRLCPLTQVFDPPSSAAIPGVEDAVLRHYVHKLSLLELNASMAILSDYVDAKLLLQISRGANAGYRTEERMRVLKDQFVRGFSDEVHLLETISRDDNVYAIRVKDLTVRDRKVHIETSCRKDLLDPFAQPTTAVSIQTRHSIGSEKVESEFSDGTCVKVEWQ